MQHWTVYLGEIDELISKGKLDIAKEKLDKFLQDFSESIDAISWGQYKQFSIISQQNGPLAASFLLPDIFNGAINFSAKLAIAKTSLEALNQEGKLKSDEGLKIAELIKNGIMKWFSNVPRPDDFNIHVARSISNYVRMTGALDPDNLFTPVGLPLNGNCIKHLPPDSGELALPKQANYILPQIRIYYENEKPTEGISFIEIRNVKAFKIGKDFFFADDNKLLYSYPHGWFPRFFLVGIEKFLTTITEEEKISGTTLSIFDSYSQKKNYCHWLVDWFPRLLLANNYNIKYEKIVGAFSIEDDFEIATLNYIDEAREKYFSLNANKLYHFDNLIVCTNVGENWRHPAYNCHKEIINSLRACFLSKEKSDKQLRLYVPRNHSRMVLNERVLEQLLSEYGFISINTDELKFDEQLELFSNATAVIGPHGAALTNLLFAPEGCKVLELFPKYGGSPAFYAISNSIKMEYSCYVDTISDPDYVPPEMSYAQFNDANMEVDLEFVKDWLDKNFSKHQ